MTTDVVIEEITFDDIYPSMIGVPFTTAVNFQAKDHGWELSVVFDYVPLTYSQGHWTEEQIADNSVGIINSAVIAFAPSIINGIRIDQKEFIERVGICYYGNSKSTASLTENTVDIGPFRSSYVRATQSMVQEANIVYNPFGGENTSFDGSNWFEWLASFGKSLTVDSGFIDILTMDIGGQSLISLLVSSGFLIYAGWCIVKWAIPS